METEICKVGFPINSLEKFTKLIEKKDYSYIVYNYDNVFNKLEIIKKYEGKNNNTLEIEEKIKYEKEFIAKLEFEGKEINSEMIERAKQTQCFKCRKL